MLVMPEQMDKRKNIIVKKEPFVTLMNAWVHVLLWINAMNMWRMHSAVHGHIMGVGIAASIDLVVNNFFYLC